MSQQELQKILADSTATYKDLNTYKFDMDMDILTDIVGGNEQGKATIISKINGAMNLASKQTQMKMDMSMNIEGTGSEDGSQSLIYDMYILTDWLYMRVEMTGTGEQWIKVPVTDELNESLGLNVVDQQMGPLDSPGKIEFLRYEKVDGQECYVLSVVPDMAALIKWISEQQGTAQDLDWADMANLSDIFKKTEYVCYIIKDSNLLKRMTVEMVMELTSEQAGASSEDFDKMTMGINMDMNLYDHNIPFSVNLPAEAENAEEVSADEFTN